MRHWRFEPAKRDGVPLRAWCIVLGGLPACAVLGIGEIELTCREPEVEIWTAEGVEAALCDLTFMACEDDSYLTVSCTNQTFGGDYGCDWTRIDGARSQGSHWPSHIERRSAAASSLAVLRSADLVGLTWRSRRNHRPASQASSEAGVPLCRGPESSIPLS